MLSYYFRLALINVRRSPSLYGLVIVTLSLGVGLLCANLALVNSMASDPFPEKSANLYHISMNTWATEDPNEEPFYIIRYRDGKAILESETPKNAAVFYYTGAYVRDAESTSLSRQKAYIRATSPGFFGLTNAPFAYGKGFDTTQGKGIVIGDSMNRKLFGGGDSVGKSVELEGEIYSIIGVLKPWHLRPLYYHVTDGNAYNKTEDFFIPLDTALDNDLPIYARSSSSESYNKSSETKDRNVFYIQAWVELENQGAVSAMQSYLDNYSQSLKDAGEHPNDILNELHDLNTWLDKNKIVDERIVAFTYATVLFLFVCVFNASSLLLARFHGAKFEIGLRRAIGASNRQMLIQGLVESTVVGLISAIIALGFSWVFLKISVEFLPRLTNIAVLDTRILIAGVAIAIVTANLSALYPLIRANRYTISAELK